MYTVGIDVGASTTKAVVINKDKVIVGKYLTKSGAELVKAIQLVYYEALRQAGFSTEEGIIPSEVQLIVGTGFGRTSIPFKNRMITEISCHSAGAYYYFPYPITVIDIGGQDNKVIKVDKNGKVIYFKMNRKCAAGTGAFIEEIAYKMGIPLEELNELAKKSTKDLALGSYCTVFSATEILTKIREGVAKEDIIRAVFTSVVKRIIEMDPLEGEIVVTGGVVAHYDVITQILGRILNKTILVPPEPQFIGAFGAAILGLNSIPKETLC